MTLRTTRLSLRSFAALGLTVVPVFAGDAELKVDARDYLLTAEDVELPLSYLEMEHMILDGDARFAPSVEAFRARVVDEAWTLVDWTETIENAPLVAEGAELAELLVEASLYGADPVGCWASDVPPRAASTAGAVFDDPDDIGGEVLQLVDLFASGEEAKRFVERVMAVLTTGPDEGRMLTLLTGTEQLPFGGLRCLSGESSYHTAAFVFDECQEVLSCWASEDNHYVIARRGPWVVRVLGYDVSELDLV